MNCKRCDRSFLTSADGENWADYAESTAFPGVCWSCLTWGEQAVDTQRDLEARYPTAHAMLQLWQMPWSGRRLKFATWALHRARRAGCDVLENPRVMESMEMACEGVV